MIGRAFVVALFLLLPLTGVAQQRDWEIGPYAGWLFGQPTAIDRAASQIKTYNTNGQGKSWDNAAIGGARLDVPFIGETSLAFRLAVSRSHGEFKSQYFFDTTNVVRFFRLIEDVDAAIASTEWQYPRSHHFYLGVGLGAEYRVQTTAIERTEPVYLALPYDTVASGGAITTSPFSIHVPISVGARIDALGWLTVAPELNLSLDPIAFAGGASLRSLRGGASISLLFHASTDTSQPLPEISRVPEPKPAIPIEPEAETIVKLHFTDEGIATNRIIASAADTTITRYVELPASVVVKPVALEIQLSSSPDTLDLASLNRAPVAYTYKHLFDILATRMLQDTTLRLAIAIAGRSSDITRVEQLLQDHFTHHGVSPRRVMIKTKTQNTPSVTIAFDSTSAAISPIVGEWSERSYILPSMSVEKFIASPRGVRSWQITLSEEDRVLKRWSSDDGAGAIVFPPLSLSTHRLLGRLDVTDTTGRAFLDYDSLMVELPDERTDSLPAGKRTDFVLLPLATRSGTWHPLVMNELRSAIQQGPTSVIIQPLSSASTHSDDIAKEVLSMLSPSLLNQFTVTGMPSDAVAQHYAEDWYLVTVRPLK